MAWQVLGLLYDGHFHSCGNTVIMKESMKGVVAGGIVVPIPFLLNGAQICARTDPDCTVWFFSKLEGSGFRKWVAFLLFFVFFQRAVQNGSVGWHSCRPGNSLHANVDNVLNVCHIFVYKCVMLYRALKLRSRT